MIVTKILSLVVALFVHHPTMCQYPSIQVWTTGPYLNAQQGPFRSYPCPTRKRPHTVLVIRKSAGRVVLVEVP